jgi:GrpB-like predicted nucleotidyltransferase (UPF0157 family)
MTDRMQVLTKDELSLIHDTAMDITVESIDVDTIKSVGSDGNYLIHDTTFKHCRNLYQPKLFTRDDYQKWHENGAKSVSEVAAEMLTKRLEEYNKPPIDEGLEQALSEFVARRKTIKGIITSLDPMKEPVKKFEDKVAGAVKEEVAIVSYDPRWPEIFELERLHLLSCLPPDLVKRIEHFGSTAVPGLSAKPIVDILIEVASLHETKQRIVPILEAQGYDYFWRPSWGDDTPPFYAWFIKRDKNGRRTHHIHMVEAGFEHWDRLLFRDYLIEHPEVAREYGDIKKNLSCAHCSDRVAYTQAKSDFIRKVTEKAKQHYLGANA